jgi:hypothetical protein
MRIQRVNVESCTVSKPGNCTRIDIEFFVFYFIFLIYIYYAQTCVFLWFFDVGWCIIRIFISFLPLFCYIYGLYKILTRFPSSGTAQDSTLSFFFFSYIFTIQKLVSALCFSWCEVVYYKYFCEFPALFCYIMIFIYMWNTFFSMFKNHLFFVFFVVPPLFSS